MRLWCVIIDERRVELIVPGQKYKPNHLDFKALLLAALLYPLERIQNIQQIQSSYANPSLQTTKSIICTYLLIKPRQCIMDAGRTSVDSPPSSPKLLYSQLR